VCVFVRFFRCVRTITYRSDGLWPYFDLLIKLRLSSSQWSKFPPRVENVAKVARATSSNGLLIVRA